MGREIRRVKQGWEHPTDSQGRYRPLLSGPIENYTEVTPEECMPAWTEAEATWLQAYEDVSEGTPISPPFATASELVDFLVGGDFWGRAWAREAAEQFVRMGYVPSGGFFEGRFYRPGDVFPGVISEKGLIGANNE